MKYIGLDVHKQYSVACILDDESGEINHTRLNNLHSEFEKLFSEDSSQYKAVLEAGRSSYPVYDIIKGMADEIQMANPLRVKIIAWEAVKTDKIDAKTLAMLLHIGWIPKSHIREQDNRLQLYLLRHRLFLVRMRTMVKNNIHALVDRQAEPIRKSHPANTDLFGKTGRQWLDSIILPPEEARLLGNLLELLDKQEELIKNSDRWINDLFKLDPVAQHLATIPGIGKFLALMIRTEIDDISRFPKVEKLHCYAGLVPSTSSSGGKTYHGKMIRNCNKWLKYALIEAVWPAIANDYEIEQIYRKHKKHKHANIAKSITARYLATIVYRLWTENRNYLPEKILSKNITNRAAFVRA